MKAKQTHVKKGFYTFIHERFKAKKPWVKKESS